MSTVCSSHSVSLVPVIFAQEITELLSPTLQAVFHKTRFLASLSPEIQRYKLASIGHDGESKFLKNNQAGASSLTTRNYGAAVILKKKKKQNEGPKMGQYFSRFGTNIFKKFKNCVFA